MRLQPGAGRLGWGDGSARRHRHESLENRRAARRHDGRRCNRA
ncbi:hypothetical protein IFR09_23965 [Pseudomonas syringae]|nr:hypothetical protein [Pseudomonas syringae]MBD8788044.1 hypothetical protein [Pseudomonas syringae]MBD8799757.1 hypothetical protein [Pseudomonas syringae]MBD8814220.1 hypothetical protein [Pseudomonas syringae]